MDVALPASAVAQSGTRVVYTTGDTVVHPRHGVATVSGITTRVDGERRTNFLELAFAATSLKILVPEDSVAEVGIRELPTKDEIAAIMAVLEGPCEVPEMWSERSASTTARMRSTELTQAAMVIRDLTLHARRTGKSLSAAENASLQSCLDSVSAELSLVLEVSQDEARALILERAGADRDPSPSSA
jgi:CarD family transcriptional regulator